MNMLLNYIDKETIENTTRIIRALSHERLHKSNMINAWKQKGALRHKYYSFLNNHSGSGW